MLKSADPNTNSNEIREAFVNDTDHELGHYFFREESIQSNYEHGQWWITHLPSGAQWSVNDTDAGFCFELVSEGSLEEWFSEEYYDEDE